ncbi:MAG: hypothetical protein WD069_11920 [Planctomycetales bacterium]
MNVAVLRVDGDESALADLQRRMKLETDEFSAWAAGETTLLGRSHERSGFRMTIADEKTQGELVEVIREFVRYCAEEGIRFDTNGLSAELGIGMTVGTSEQFTASVRFAPEDLIAIGRLGVELCVSAYPACDPDDDEGNDATSIDDAAPRGDL